MPPMPYWVLALIFWLHLLATVTWVGSLAAISFLILPAASRTLNPTDQLAFISAIQKRLEPLAWFCLSVLVTTGLFQMSVNVHYDGFLSVSTRWSIALLTKHALVAVMVVVSAVQTWEVLPAIRRTLMLKARADEGELERLRRRETALLRWSLALAVLILLATAFARAA